MSDLCFDDIDQNCDECYELTQEDCLPEVIQSGLTPAATYWLWCIAPDGNYYKDEITIAGDGSFTIDVDSGAYPTGLFNKYAGKFEFFLSTSQTDPTPTAFTISAVSYNCLIMEWTVNCCDNTYTPPTDCDKLLDTLSPSELNTCILPTYDFSDAVNVQPNVTAQQQTDLIAWLCTAEEQKNISSHLKTGQTTAYRTNDDGDLERGRESSFTVLSSNNPYGNTNRFCDTTGAQTYANDWVIDWAYADYVNQTVIGWYRVLQGTGSFSTAMALQPLTLGGFGACYVPNATEANSICNYEVNTVLNYAPFNITGNLWTSTTAPNNTANAKAITAAGLAQTAKSNTGVDFICMKIFNFSQLGL